MITLFMACTLGPEKQKETGIMDTGLPSCAMSNFNFEVPNTDFFYPDMVPMYGKLSIGLNWGVLLTLHVWMSFVTI